MKAAALTFPRLGAEARPVLFDVVVLAADSVFAAGLLSETLPPELEADSDTSAAAVTIPALVNTNPEIATKGFGLATNVSVDTCLSFNLALLSICAIDVKQNNSEFRGVVDQPPGQHTLVVPVTEKVENPLVWHVPAPRLATDVLGAQPTRDNMVVVPLAVSFVVLGVTGVGH